MKPALMSSSPTETPTKKVNTMKTLILALSILSSSTAFAAAPKVYVANGAVIPMEKALDAALAGKQVMACAPQELKRNAKGTGVTLHARKE